MGIYIQVPIYSMRFENYLNCSADKRATALTMINCSSLFILWILLKKFKMKDKPNTAENITCT